MELRKENINGMEFLFVNEWASTRNGFKHTSTLFINGYEWQKSTCHYINRTWENYAFQTVMLRAIADLMEKIYDRELEHYKNINNIKRLTKAKKEDFENNLENEKYKNLLELRKIIRGNVW